jgi:hypothetical protein
VVAGIDWKDSASARDASVRVGRAALDRIPTKYTWRVFSAAAGKTRVSRRCRGAEMSNSPFHEKTDLIPVI